MKDFPRISIITTCFNAAEVLERTIQSVMEQNYPSIQHIVIDGASSDGTVNLIESYRDAIDFYVSEPDHGLYDGLNKGLTKVNGEFVLFLHAGDTFFNSGTLSLYMEYGQKMDFIFGNTLVIGEDGQEKTWHKQPKNPESLQVDDFLLGMIVCHQSMLVRKNIIPFFQLQYKIASDIDWVINTLKRTTKIKYIDEFVCRYYRGGISERSRIRALVERAIILIKHFGFLKSLKAHGTIIKNWTNGMFRKWSRPGPEIRLLNKFISE